MCDFQNFGFRPGPPLSTPTRTHNSGPILTKVHSFHPLIRLYYAVGVFISTFSRH
jgi:hypothetical protein